MRTEQSVSTIDEQLRALLDEAWQALSHQQQELDLLTEQTRLQVGRESERFAQLKPKLEALDRTLERYSREELRQLFQAAKEREVRLVTLRTELGSLEYKRSLLAQDARALARFGALLAGGEPDATPLGAQAPAFVAAPATGDVGALLLAQESDRERLALLLHDSVAQPLHNLVLQTEVLPRAFKADPSNALAEIESLRDMATRVLQDARRVIFELRPMSLNDLGLMPTLDRYVRVRAERDGLTTRLRTEGRPRPLGPAIETAVFRIVQAALDNVVGHAEVRDAEVVVGFGDRELTVAIADAGRGCDLHLAQASHGGTGMLGMQGRARQVSGSLQFDTAPGRGMTVHLTVPLTSPLDGGATPRHRTS
jgi:two-component system, NarL family, sensor histidine kinase DegS